MSGKVDDALFKRGLIVSLAITGGLCLILWVMPSMLLDFRSSFDAQYQLPDWYYNALLMDRASLASADAMRSLIFILLGAALLFWYYTVKDRKKAGTIVGIGVAVLMLADLWTVDKRYLKMVILFVRKLWTCIRRLLRTKRSLRIKILLIV